MRALLTRIRRAFRSEDRKRADLFAARLSASLHDEGWWLS